MGRVNLFRLLLVMLLITSCSNEKDDILVIQKQNISFQAIGGLQSVEIDSNWESIYITNLNGQEQWGDVQTEKGLLKTNEKLKLQSPGSFSIKDSYLISFSRDVLTISVEENYNIEEDEPNPNAFIIHLTYKDKRKEILISQKKSEGYSVKSMSYYLSEGDKDSTFLLKGEKPFFTVHNDSPAKEEIGVKPLEWVISTIRFTTEQDSRFLDWVNEQNFLVDIPHDIVNGEIYTGLQLSFYSGRSAFVNDLKNAEDTISFDGNTNVAFYTDITWRERTVSYTLFMENNKTKNIKEIKGKCMIKEPISWKIRKEEI